MAWFRDHAIPPEAANPVLEAARTAPIERPVRARELVRRPAVTARALLAAAEDAPVFCQDVLATVEIDTQYEGYVRRERDRAEKLRAQAEFEIPADAPFCEFATLSYEARQKLDRIRPTNLAQASRIPGVSPADLQNLVMELRKRSWAGGAEASA